MDRKRLGGFVAIALVSALSSGPSNAATGQVERGYALVPAPGRVAGIWVESCQGVVEATLQWAARRSLHPHFPVKSSTWGKAFTLKPMHPAADLDVSFRKGSSTWIRFDSRHLGGEHGLVPVGAVEAFVCLARGAPTLFTYRAGTGA